MKTGQAGQSLTEFAAVLPVLILLFAGILDLGRAFYFEVISIDAARDGARLLVGNNQGTGPGLPAVCKLVGADLDNFGVTPTCRQVSHTPPYTAPGDYAAPGSNQVVVLVYCGQYSSDCVNADRSSCGTQSCPNQVAVYVYYGFGLLTGPISELAGGAAIQMQNGAQMVTAW